MRSRAMRTALSAAALLIVGAAAAFLIDSERHISVRRDSFRAFDQRAREVAGKVGAMRAAQQAYVAAGQGVDFWIPEVAALLASSTGSIDELRQFASTPEAGQALTEAAAGVSEFGEVDQRARDYLRGGEPLMSSLPTVARPRSPRAISSRRPHSPNSRPSMRSRRKDGGGKPLASRVPECGWCSPSCCWSRDRPQAQLQSHRA
jgi:hypothetical protein